MKNDVQETKPQEVQVVNTKVQIAERNGGLSNSYVEAQNFYDGSEWFRGLKTIALMAKFQEVQVVSTKVQIAERNGGFDV